MCIYNSHVGMQTSNAIKMDPDIAGQGHVRGKRSRKDENRNTPNIDRCTAKVSCVKAEISPWKSLGYVESATICLGGNFLTCLVLRIQGIDRAILAAFLHESYPQILRRLGVV